MSDYNSNGSVPPLIPGDIYVSEAMFTGSVKMTSDATTPHSLTTEASSKLGLFGVDAVVQQTATQPTASYVAGSTNPAFLLDTYNGYTVADVVVALQKYGLLA